MKEHIKSEIISKGRCSTTRRHDWFTNDDFIQSCDHAGKTNVLYGVHKRAYCTKLVRLPFVPLSFCTCNERPQSLGKVSRPSPDSSSSLSTSVAIASVNYFALEFLLCRIDEELTVMSFSKISNICAVSHIDVETLREVITGSYEVTVSNLMGRCAVEGAWFDRGCFEG